MYIFDNDVLKKRHHSMQNVNILEKFHIFFEKWYAESAIYHNRIIDRIMLSINAVIMHSSRYSIQ